MLHQDGKDITLVASTNHPPKMWTIHVPSFEWPQCNCPIATQGIICKHVTKIFQMLHPCISDGAIVRKTGTLHGVHRGLALDVHINFVDMLDQEVNVNEKPDNVDTLETTNQKEAYTTFILGEFIDKVFTQLKTIVCDFPPLHKHLLSRLTFLRGKQYNMLA
jgi:hypothetical protein